PTSHRAPTDRRSWSQKGARTGGAGRPPPSAARRPRRSSGGCPNHKSAGTGPPYLVLLSWAASERCEGKTKFACVLTSWGGATVIRTGTHQDQLHNRAKGTNTPRSRLAGSALQYAPLRLHFHPLPCRAPTSRFTTPLSPRREPARAAVSG